MTDLELYNKAKEAYYNGNPIMTDFEFDELEKKLGLENNSYIGARKNPSYTIKHPFVMGSLSKVQIKENTEGQIIFKDYVDDINKYLNKSNANTFIVTPKYDGCSFEVVVSENHDIISISSRGDGEWGKDLKSHLLKKVKPNVEALNKKIPANYVLRGEVLIDKTIFENKYSEFVNPRSFVSGLLNRDYCNEIKSMLDDLSIVIYDIRFMDDHAKWIDTDWMNYDYPDKPAYYFTIGTLSDYTLAGLYKNFEIYRNEDCPFALDGIVFKPIAGYRENNLTEHRPKDCVAVKFAPQLQETEVVDIQWQLSNKTGEYTPVIIVNPVIMDGKQVTRASAHNYGYIIDNKISVGTKVILSLAGDIIPFIYKITDTSAFDINKICINTDECDIVGIHIYKQLSESDKIKNSFLASCTTLSIPNIGPAAAERIFEYINNKYSNVDNTLFDFFDMPTTIKEVDNNILKVNANDIEDALGGKLGKNAKKSFIEFITNISLKDIIASCSYELCGYKTAEMIEEYLLTDTPNFSSVAEVAYSWVFDKNSDKYKNFESILKSLNKTLEDFKENVSVEFIKKSNQIPVILTGEPNNYLSKADFMNKHPEYRETGSWKEVQIVFTNSLDSTTGKMKKAKEKGIKIEVY